MNESYAFLRSILDTVTDHIVAIDKKGNILFVNNTWKSFGKDNSCLMAESWDGVNYLNECDKAAKMGDDFGIQAAKGIRSVISKETEDFYFEYPCNSPDEKRWFMMRVTPFTLENIDYFVISHQNITERKLAEEKLLDLSRLDGLTGIANRRYFDNFLEEEWRRCHRLGLPISLAIIDLDYFKLLNDHYGHQTGDECLKAVAKSLKQFVRRPSDLCARYGGEEFSLVFGNTGTDQAKVLINKALEEIRLLNIPNEESPTHPTLTASIGLTSMLPDEKSNEHELLKRADDLLYDAKRNGRNQVVCK